MFVKKKKAITNAKMRLVRKSKGVQLNAPTIHSKADLSYEAPVHRSFNVGRLA